MFLSRFKDYEVMLEETWHIDFPRRPDVSDGLYSGICNPLQMWENYPYVSNQQKKEDNIGLGDAITKSILSTDWWSCFNSRSYFGCGGEIADRIVNSRELATYMFELGQAGYDSGRKDGYSEGRAAVANKEKDYHFVFYKEDCAGKYAEKRKEFSSLEFAVVKAAQKLSWKPDGVALLKKALGDEGRSSGDGGTSHQK
ncbi:hypothetical protein HanPI659440_Chr13g0520271 [Helianthus annuus]|nr:hypothetical protein HanPI659440_Chr13g0520271 [Helianthus annuus]